MTNRLYPLILIKGTVPSNKLLFKEPLQLQDDKVGIRINTNDLIINTQTGALELNDVYTSLIDWTTEPSDVISPNIHIMGIVGLGVKEITKDITLSSGSENIGNRFINNIWECYHIQI